MWEQYILRGTNVLFGDISSDKVTTINPEFGITSTRSADTCILYHILSQSSLDITSQYLDEVDKIIRLNGRLIIVDFDITTVDDAALYEYQSDANTRSFSLNELIACLTTRGYTEVKKVDIKFSRPPEYVVVFERNTIDTPIRRIPMEFDSIWRKSRGNMADWLKRARTIPQYADIISSAKQ
jgi:hypothetical protein